MTQNSHPKLGFILFFLMTLNQLTGCVNHSTPALDATFGHAVRAARQAQTLNPGPAELLDPSQGQDGKAAVNLIERYQDSFKSPPKTFEVLNIGGAVSGQ